ncbi:MAG: hypothetical protein ABSA86_04665 [Oryzomonas sp.]|jgi:hypothetical protein
MKKAFVVTLHPLRPQVEGKHAPGLRQDVHVVCPVAGKDGGYHSQKTPQEIFQRPLKDSLLGFADPKLTIPSVRFSENK